MKNSYIIAHLRGEIFNLKQELKLKKEIILNLETRVRRFTYVCGDDDLGRIASDAALAREAGKLAGGGITEGKVRSNIKNLVGSDNRPTMPPPAMSGGKMSIQEGIDAGILEDNMPEGNLSIDLLAEASTTLKNLLRVDADTKHERAKAQVEVYRELYNGK